MSKGYGDENVGVGGKRRERVIDTNVTRMAGRSKAPDGGKPPARARRQKAQPSSYAPSGKKYKGTPSFGAPIQETGKPRPKK